MIKNSNNYIRVTLFTLVLLLSFNAYPADDYSFVFCGPASGKSTLSKANPTAVFDPEDYMGDIWNDEKLLPKLGINKIFELNQNWPFLWNRYVIPRILAGNAIGKKVLVSLVTPSNAGLISLLMQHLKLVEKVAVLNVPDNELVERVENDAKRPSGLAFRHLGPLHTQTIHYLLAGIAGKAAVPLVQQYELEDQIKKYQLNQSESAQILEYKTRKFIEYAPMSWVECNIDDGDNICLFNAVKDESGFPVLKCDKSTPFCHKFHGGSKCSARVKLERNAYFYEKSPSKWHKLEEAESSNPHSGYFRESKEDRPVLHIDLSKLNTEKRDSQSKNAVIYYEGSFAPIHQGHLDTANWAKQGLEEMGYHVLGGYIAPHPQLRPGSKAHLTDIESSWKNRALMAHVAAQTSDWLMVDSLRGYSDRFDDTTQIKYGQHVSQQLGQRIKAIKPELGEDLTVFWVVGSDASFSYKQFKYLAQQDGILLKMLVIDNDRKNLKNQWSDLPRDISPHVVHHKPEFKSERTDRSSSKVRSAGRSGHMSRTINEIGDQLPGVAFIYLSLLAEKEKQHD